MHRDHAVEQYMYRDTTIHFLLVYLIWKERCGLELGQVQKRTLLPRLDAE